MNLISQFLPNLLNTLVFKDKLVLHTGWPILLATPKFTYVLKSREKSPEQATLWNSKTWHPQNMSPILVSSEVASSVLSHFLWLASPGLSHFRGWPVQDSFFFFQILAHREIWEVAKKMGHTLLRRKNKNQISWLDH